MDNFIEQVLSLAKKNVEEGDGGPFAALVVKNGQVIATGTNRVTADNDPSAHAEIVAIRAACAKLGTFQLQDCTVYASCEPCPMCLAALYWARPERIYYAAEASDAAAAGFDDAHIYQELSKMPEARLLKASRIAHADSLEPFNAWAAKEDKQPY